MAISISNHIAWQIIDEEAVIVDLRSGVTIGLNPTASFVWSRLSHESPHEIGAELARRYGIDATEAAIDVARFVDDLCNRQLVVEG